MSFEMASARVRGPFEDSLLPASSNLDLWHGFARGARVRHGFGRLPPTGGGGVLNTAIYIYI